MTCKDVWTYTSAEEVDSLGKEFAYKYYDAFVGKPAAVGLEHFFGDKSEYIFLQHGRRPDFAVRGVVDIGRFVARMKYRNSTLKIKSIDAITVRRNWFAVLTVGDMARLGEQVPRTFVQSTVLKYSPSSEKRFSIVGTVFKFDDAIVDDVFGDETAVNSPTPQDHDRGPGQNRGTADDGVVAAAEVSDGTAVGDESPMSKRPVVAEAEDAPGERVERESAETVGSRPVEDNVLLYVGGLSKTVTADDLRATFDRYGVVTFTQIRQSVKKKGCPGRRPFGIVEFENPATANAVIQCGTVVLDNGEEVVVDKSNRRK